METPEKIYFSGQQQYSNPFIGLMQKCTDTDVEYTRTDAIIKKAEEVFCKATCNGHPPRSSCISLGTCKKYDNFVKFMKGE